MNISFKEGFAVTKIARVKSTGPMKLEGKNFIFSKIFDEFDDIFLVSLKEPKQGEQHELVHSIMDGGKGPFDAYWTKDAKDNYTKPLAAAPVTFKEGEETKVSVKIIDSKPKMKLDGTHSYYESKFGTMYHYTTTFEHEGVAVVATSQSKDTNKPPFTKGEQADIIVTVKNGYVNIKKAPAPFGGKPFGGGGSSKHDAWARIYVAHYMAARESNVESDARRIAINAANEVIKAMEV